MRILSHRGQEDGGRGDGGQGLRVILLTVAFLRLASMAPSFAGAALPDELPSYSDARALRADATLRSVAFRSDQIGIACGDRGTILRTRDGGETWEPCESGVDVTLSDVQWVSGNRVVAVGGSIDRITNVSRGVVLTSADAGVSWTRAADEEMPKLKQLQWVDEILVARGDWSDSLLTDLFESRDRGQTWHAGQPESAGETDSSSATDLNAKQRASSVDDLSRWAAATKNPNPVRDACRVSDESLCAVGDHGVILLSRDRGKSWSAVRGKDRRTAIVMASHRAESVAWSLLGMESLEARGRTSLLIETDSRGRSSANNTMGRHEAVMQAAISLGACGADRIGRDGENLEQSARKWIQLYRPAILVVDAELSPTVSDALVQAAVALGVQRVVRYSSGGRGDTVLHRNALLPHTGILASDLHTDAMQWVAPLLTDASSITLKYLYDAQPASRRDSVMSGVNLPDGFKLTAARPNPSRRKLQIAQARMGQVERIGELISRSRNVGQFAELLATALDQTGREDQFRLAWHVVRRTSTMVADSNAIALHEAALAEFASRFSSTSAGRWAALRAEVIRNSVEWQQVRSTLSDSIAADKVDVVNTVAVSPFQFDEGGVRQASGVAPLVVPKPDTINLNRRPKNAPEDSVDLAWEFHPAVLFAREAARQRNDHGKLQAADEESSNLTRLADADREWSHLLLASHPETLFAARATAPPRLDGVIDDPCWVQSNSASINGTRLRAAYDENYFYLAIECDSELIGDDLHAGQHSASQRDQDLSVVDRVSCWIDVDSDLMSSMQLQVSAAGRVRDSIDSLASWQPTWYPAVRRDGHQLTVELAVLRRDLVELPIVARESWLIKAAPLAAGRPEELSPMPISSQWRRIIFQP